MFPPEEYYRLTHMDIPKSHLLFAESIIGQIDELNNQQRLVHDAAAALHGGGKLVDATGGLPPAGGHERGRILRHDGFRRSAGLYPAFQRADAAVGELRTADCAQSQAAWADRILAWAATMPSARPASIWPRTWMGRSTSGHEAAPSGRCHWSTGSAPAPSPTSRIWSPTWTRTRRKCSKASWRSAKAISC